MHRWRWGLWAIVALTGCKALSDREDRKVRDRVLDAVRGGDADRLAELTEISDVASLQDELARCAIDWANAEEVAAEHTFTVMQEHRSVDNHWYRHVYRTPTERIELTFDTYDHRPTVPRCFRLPMAAGDGFATRPRSFVAGDREVHYPAPVDWQDASSYGDVFFHGPVGFDLSIRAIPCPDPASCGTPDTDALVAALRLDLTAGGEAPRLDDLEARADGVEAQVTDYAGVRRFARVVFADGWGRVTCLARDGGDVKASASADDARALCRQVAITAIGAPRP